jgi:hypothetical protein
VYLDIFNKPVSFSILHAESMGKMRNAYKILVEKSERKRRLGWPGCRWEDNIKMYLQEIGCEDVGYISLTQH